MYTAVTGSAAIVLLPAALIAYYKPADEALRDERCRYTPGITRYCNLLFLTSYLILCCSENETKQNKTFITLKSHTGSIYFGCLVALFTGVFLILKFRLREVIEGFFVLKELKVGGFMWGRKVSYSNNNLLQ